MKTIHVSTEHATAFVDIEELACNQRDVVRARNILYKQSGKGKEFLGWLHLPSSVQEEELAAIEQAAAFFKSHVDYVVVIGIGGSYLGTKAVVESLQPSFKAYTPDSEWPHILYAGHHISEDYLSELSEFLQGKRFGIIVISKSGTTTEPAIAFRILKAQLEQSLPAEEVAKYIVAVTDAQKGALRKLAEQSGYQSFVIPDNVGGRFSVLTPVGRLPIAVAGLDIRSFLKGAAEMERFLEMEPDLEKNPAMKYALIRNQLFHSGFLIEILANYHPNLHFITEWWKQLYGESEGKLGTGIFPAGVDLTTDLHSMGQYIQDGQRILFETVLTVLKPKRELRIPLLDTDDDELNYLAGKRMDEVNKMAELGTRMAHVEGNVPNILIELPELNEYYLGQLLYFYENACAISGYMLDVNPFDQPGVEAYKKNMFALLGKK
ncbi:MAG: glucose-6-phosphate isomerase [Bacteroidales bacterium]|nr:glucose-6-phosphate isomerase [Bacteroidales bacterium]